MLVFGAVLMFILSYAVPIFATIKFLAHPLTFMMIYLWGRSPENVNVRLSFFGILVFSAPYLPWAMLAMSFFFGNPIETDLLGIVAGHIYYFFEFVYPAVAKVRGWRCKRILRTPVILKRIFGQDITDNGLGEVEV
jgi:Derlin-2/3